MFSGVFRSSRTLSGTHTVLIRYSISLAKIVVTFVFYNSQNCELAMILQVVILCRYDVGMGKERVNQPEKDRTESVVSNINHVTKLMRADRAHEFK